MALNWKREPWRKLYTREEGSFATLPFFARATAALLIKLVDDHGVIHLGGREPWEAIAFQLGATRGERRLLHLCVDRLLADGYLVRGDGDVRIRNFQPAQARWDRVRGDHDLASERAGTAPEATRNRAGTALEPRWNCTGTALEDRRKPRAGSASAGPLDPIRNDTTRHEDNNVPETPAPPAAAPPSRAAPVPDPDAFLLADRLRDAVLAVKPNHRVGEAAGWNVTRRAWARQMARLLKRRPRPALEAAIAFVQESAGEPYALVIESAKSLDEKLDRVEQAMQRARRPNGTVSRHFQVTGAEVYRDGEVEI